MRKSLIILGIAFLGQTTVANAATDWTPYLKPMLLGCDEDLQYTDIPNRYKASIASKKVKGDTNDEPEEIVTTYTLKDSTAFGMPLTKVEVLSGNEWAHLTLFFKDNKFKTLRPKFKLPKIDPVHMKVLENNASGYEIKMPGDKRNRSLIFNAKQKTITCDW